ncbi:putative lactoylglutathione lyase [Xylogone sp. PMI_703]|nr:putative lactoylglutathione lyase [Xylogone sp. PMI_703]
MAQVPNSFANLSSLPVGEHLPGGHRLDPVVTPATAGNRLNHLMIRIRDPEETLHFYIDLMGMRTVFAMNAGPMTVYYLGFPQTEEHYDPAKYAEHVWPHKTMAHTLGLIELNHFHGSEKLSKEEFQLESGNRPPHLGFGHLGFTVPDIPATLERLTANGVKVIKALGVSTRASIPISDWESDSFNIGRGELHDNFNRIYGQIAVVEDPNGYWVELVPQELR